MTPEHLAEIVADLREVGLSQQHIDTDFARSTNAAGACRRAADALEALLADRREKEAALGTARQMIANRNRELRDANIATEAASSTLEEVVGALEKIAGPRDANSSYRELHNESCDIAREAGSASSETLRQSVMRPAPDAVIRWIGIAYESGWTHAKAKSRLIVTDTGTVDAAQFVMDAARADLFSSETPASRVGAMSDHSAPATDHDKPHQSDGEGAWQSIETAPRDGTAIIAYWASCRWMGEAYYHEDDGRWMQANSHPTDYTDGEVFPTHWVPLPAPPQPIGQAEGS